LKGLECASGPDGTDVGIVGCGSGDDDMLGFDIVNVGVVMPHGLFNCEVCDTCHLADLVVEIGIG
jgi:hypothetical protein